MSLKNLCSHQVEERDKTLISRQTEAADQLANAQQEVALFKKQHTTATAVIRQLEEGSEAKSQEAAVVRGHLQSLKADRDQVSGQGFSRSYMSKPVSRNCIHCCPENAFQALTNGIGRRASAPAEANSSIGNEDLS